MQKRKFDELISHFNRKVSEMNIDQKYKMELLGMISAIGFAHEKELGTDCISRQQAIDTLENDKAALDKIIKGMSAEDMLLKYFVAQHNQVSCDIDAIVQLPPIQPKRIRGQWSIKGQAIDVVRGYWAKCSACGHAVFGGGNYCSYCGSYNKGEVTT